MSDEILVQPDNPLDVKPEELHGLVEDVRGLGDDAFVAYRDHVPGTYGVTWWEVVTIWVGMRASEAVIDRVVGYAVAWMRDRFRSHQDDARGRRPKAVRIVKYDGDTGIAVEVVELASADAEPVRKPSEAFELYTRKKPPIR